MTVSNISKAFVCVGGKGMHTCLGALVQCFLIHISMSLGVLPERGKQCPQMPHAWKNLKVKGKLISISEKTISAYQCPQNKSNTTSTATFSGTPQRAAYAKKKKTTVVFYVNHQGDHKIASF